MHTNQAASTRIQLLVGPGPFTGPEVWLNTRAPNQWYEEVVEFTAFSNFVTVEILNAGLVLGNSGSPGGVDEIYVDGVWFGRLD